MTIVGRLAPRAEPELASRLRGIFSDEGIAVIDARATAVEPRGETKVVHTDENSSIEADAILVATGRRARVNGLDPAAAGIELDDQGFVKVDDTLRTTKPKWSRPVMSPAARSSSTSPPPRDGSRRTMRFAATGAHSTIQHCPTWCSPTRRWRARA